MEKQVLEDKLFQPEEAEALVKAARQHLQTAEGLRQRGRRTESCQEEAAADAILWTLLSRLRPRLVRYAKAGFRNSPDQGIVDEAIQQMALALIRRLRHPTQGELFERKFNKAVKFPISDAIKKVRRENGMDEDGLPIGGKAPISWEAQFGRAAGGEDSLSPEDRQADPEALADLERLVDGLAREQLLARIPNPLHAQVLSDHLHGRTLKEIAKRAGICEKSATKYIKQSFALMRELLAEPKEE
jgi:DNA-directed RNA polymerase specialized sigma24 family protein